MPRPNFDEIAQITRDLNYAYLMGYKRLISRDEILNLKGGGDLKLYETVAQDDQVKSCIQQRISAVISHDWGVEPGDDSKSAREVAEFIKQELKNLQWDKICEKMLWGMFYGYSVGEILWRRGDKIGIADIRVRNRRRFIFGTDLQPKLIVQEDPMGEDLPPQKFWHFSCGGDNDDDPYGRGLAHWLYWPTFFKRSDMRWWVTFLEKYAQPSRLGKYQPGASEGDKETLWQAMDAFGTNGKMLIPEGTMIELLEASRAGGADYQGMLDACNEAISKIILSQTMTTDNGSSLSQANVHQTVKDDIVKADADLICSSFNESVVKWLTDWNFPGAAYPRVWRQMDAAKDLEAEADRDTKLQGLGIYLKPEAIAAKYGDDYLVSENKEQLPQLNGEQTTALLSIVSTAKQGSWGPKLVTGMLNAAFPSWSEEAVATIVENLVEDEDEAEFAATPKKKACVKGLSCGGSCISALKICVRELDKETAAMVAALRKRVKAGDVDAVGELDKFRETRSGTKTKSALDLLLDKLEQISVDKPNGREEARYLLELIRSDLLSTGLSQEQAEEMMSHVKVQKAGVKLGERERYATINSATEFLRLTNGVGGSSLKSIVKTAKRAYSSMRSGKVNTGYGSRRDIFHEIAHLAEHETDTSQKHKDWVLSRATGGLTSLRRLTGQKEYAASETAYPDKFVSPYVGKFYPDATEVLSVGLEHFSSPSAMLDLFTEDKQHFNLVIDFLKETRNVRSQG